MTDKQREMTERELAEFYDAHRGDTSIWQPEAVRARTPRGDGPSIVISVRFTRKEVRAIKEAAVGEATTLSEFIRCAALNRASTTGATVRTRIFNAPPMQPHLSFFTVSSTQDPERRSA